MCLFTGPVQHVSGTRIYAGPRDNGNGSNGNASTHQRIAYQMTVDVPDSLAMVLPIPTPPNPSDDAVSFVDVSSAPQFFDDLDVLFPRVELASSSRGSAALRLGVPPSVLRRPSSSTTSASSKRPSYRR